MTRLLRYRHDGLTFDVRDEGPLEGDAVVLLHGFPERSTGWSDGDIAVKRQPVDRCADHVTGPYELRVLEGVSHWIPTHAPEAVADALLSRIGSLR